MADPLPRKIFVNLAVRDPARSREFFAALGFTFHPKYTNEAAACMIVSPDAYVMLLAEPHFKSFTDREICATGWQTECLVAFSCESRAAVEELVGRALALGGNPAKPPQDHGMMFGWSFYDLDGHHWEPFWMDAAAA